MSITLHTHQDLPELEHITHQSQSDGLTDITYRTLYHGLTRTRRVLTLGDGLFMAHTTIETPVELVLLVDNPAEGMEMHVNLSGSAHSWLGGRRVEFRGAQHNQLFFSGFQQGIHYAPHSPYSCLEIDCWPLGDLRQRLIYCPDQLEEHMARVEAGQSFTLGPARPLTPQQQRIVHELLTCSLTGPYRRMYLEAKIWELYALQAEQFSHEPPNPTKLSPQDIERLYQVRDLMEQSMDNPASLVELTRQTGLNLDKLKRGFKSVFGTTVFGYLHQIRMRKAHELLLSGNYSVAEVAYTVGYKNPQHFTAAFKKHFSYLPRALSL